MNRGMNVTAPKLFGTNGVRGIVNRELTSEMALQMGKAIGTVMKGTVAVATDTRSSGHMIRAALSAGLMAVGVNVIVLGTVPTPALQYYVKTHENVEGGVMITASHNPPPFNGIKCVSADGTEASKEEERKIEELFITDIPVCEWGCVGVIDHINEAGKNYVNAVLSNVDADAIMDADLTVCLDCANGAAFETTPSILKKLKIKTVTLNCNAQGEFPGRPSEPTEDNLSDLIALMKNTNASLGIAHDGDADRCVFITEKGEFVSGDKSLALLAKLELSKNKGGKVVTPVSSSSLVEEIVKDSGGTLIYTAVGSPVVARKMKETGAVFGGEENGGLIFPDMQYCRDGAMTVAKMLECIALYGSLSEQVAELPVYHTQKRKLDCPNDLKEALIGHLKETVTGNIDDTDGLKIIHDDGWVLVRPSGTEPIFRVYSESKDEKVSIARADTYEAIAAEFLNSQ